MTRSPEQYAYTFGIMKGKKNVPAWREFEQLDEDEEGVDPCCHIYLNEEEWDKLQTEGWIELEGEGWSFEAEARY